MDFAMCEILENTFSVEEFRVTAFFYVLCKTYKSKNLLKKLLESSYYFFQTSRCIVFILKMVERMKILIKHNRCTFIGVKIVNRKFSLLFEAILT